MGRKYLRESHEMNFLAPEWTGQLKEEKTVIGWQSHVQDPLKVPGVGDRALSR